MKKFFVIFCILTYLVPLYSLSFKKGYSNNHMYYTLESNFDFENIDKQCKTEKIFCEHFDNEYFLDPNVIISRSIIKEQSLGSLYENLDDIKKEFNNKLGIEISNKHKYQYIIVDNKDAYLIRFSKYTQNYSVLCFSVRIDSSKLEELKKLYSKYEDINKDIENKYWIINNCSNPNIQRSRIVSEPHISTTDENKTMMTRNLNTGDRYITTYREKTPYIYYTYHTEYYTDSNPNYNPSKVNSAKNALNTLESNKISLYKKITDLDWYSLYFYPFSTKNDKNITDLIVDAKNGSPKAQLYIAEVLFSCGNDDFQDAIEWGEKAANQGYTEAQTFMSLQYLTNSKIINYEKAFYWATEAAKSNSPEAFYYLGYLYSNGFFVNKDKELAFLYEKKSAENGFSAAYSSLGSSYYYGLGTNCNYNEAFKWLLKAVNSDIDSPASYTLLGVCYYDGAGTNRDINLAKKYLSIGSEQGDSLGKYIYSTILPRNTEDEKKLFFNNMLDLSKINYADSTYLVGKCYLTGIGIEKNYQEAYKYFKKAQESSDIEVKEKATVQIANCLLNGYGCPIDIQEAINLLEQLEKTDNAQSKVELAKLYREGTYLKKDINKSIKLLNEAVTMGSAEALYEIGNCYYLGIGYKEDKSKALKYYGEAAKKGNLDAYFSVGLLNFLCENYENSFELFEYAGNKNHVLAQYYLGFCYLNGYGTEINDSKSMEWFEKAAKNGNIESMYYLGCLYEDNNKEKEAFYWFEEAATNNDSDAMGKLSYCYNYGIGTEKDLSKAFYWMKKSAENQNPEGAYSLSKLYEEGIGTNKDDELALKWMLKAAELNDSDAMLSIGNRYLNGRSVEKDLKKAFLWTKKSAENQNSSGAHNLAYMYENGIGTDIDTKLSFEWYIKAAEYGSPNDMYYIASVYENMNDIEHSLYWYTKAAENGSTKAQMQLGVNYYGGIGGVETDPDKALFWFKKAEINAEDANPYFLYSFLGDLYWYYKDDYKLGFEYKLKAAEIGNIECINFIGCCYLDGYYVEKNLDSAIEWFLKSSQNGDAEGLFFLGICRDINNEKGEAFSLFLESADMGYDQAQYSVGYCFYFGVGTEIDVDKAYEYMIKAKEQGNKRAEEFLKNNFE